ncbi:UPF0182 family membrane protein [Nocardioides ultimimeridianus]
MSELFDDEPEDVPAPPRRRGRWLIALAVGVVVFIFLLSAFASLYTDGLWYHEVHYGEVFSTLLWTKVGLFLVFGGLMAAVVGGNIVLAYRMRPLFRMGGDASVERYRDAVTPIRGWLLAGVCVVVGAFAGTSGIGQWRNYLLWRNATPFHQKDAYFHKDIGFYVFRLPWWHCLADYVMAVAIVAVLATAVVHYVYGGIRLHLPSDRLSGAAQVQISALAGLFVLAKAADYFLGRYDLVTDDHSLFTGMNYTGQNAVLPARNILLGVALICAVLFFLNIWRRTWQLPTVGLALLALSAILIGMIWPAIVQGFQVKPSEADKENPFMQANIDATQQAYRLDSVNDVRSTGTATGKASAATLEKDVADVPVVDPKQVSDTFQQLQLPANYYQVPNVLDVDHYKIKGQQEPLVLGVRELDQTGIPPADQSWANLHTVYTHGDGVIAAYANNVTPLDTANSTNSGRLVWAEGLNDSTKGVKTDHDLGDYRSQIYYGEDSPAYSIVGRASSSAPEVELSLSPGSAGGRTTTYTGSGGVPIGGTFNQLMYAIKFGEPNFLLSGRVNSASKVLYNRDPAQRVEKVAPWLTVDSDPYPAVVDGHVEWIVDGYTTTDRYPDSQSESFRSMIDDSLQESGGASTLPTDKINYMRSAVKATVDAYDGTVTLYQWDQEDPILQTWMKAFPGTVQPEDAIPPDLKAHLRYPEDLFKVQRYQLAKYHVTDATQFLAASDQWSVPADPNSVVDTQMQPPYRMFIDQDGTQQWSLTSDFVPRGKNTLAAYMSVNSDATSNDFGKIQLTEMSNAGVDGPGTIANAMSGNAAVKARLRLFPAGSAAMGNLLTVPLDGTYLYVQPVYGVRGGTSSFRILQFVIVSYNGKVGVGNDLASALRDALNVPGGNGGNGGTGGKGSGGPGPGGSPGQTLTERIDAAIAKADAAFARADLLQRQGKTVEWAKQLAIAKQQVALAASLAAERPAK